MRILPALLKEAREALTVFNEAEPPRSHPVYTTLLLLVSAVFAATGGVRARLAAFSVGLILAASMRERRVVTALIYPLVVSLVASLPAAIMSGYNPLDLVSRSVVPALLVASVTIRVGWSTIAEGLTLLGAPKQVYGAIRTLPAYIRMLLGELVSIAAAREARSLGKLGVRQVWRLQASSLGELIVRSMVKAEMLSKAVRARTLGDGGVVSRSGSRHDILVYVSLVFVTAMGVMDYVYG